MNVAARDPPAKLISRPPQPFGLVAKLEGDAAQDQAAA